MKFQATKEHDVRVNENLTQLRQIKRAHLRWNWKTFDIYA